MLQRSNTEILLRSANSCSMRPDPVRLANYGRFYISAHYMDMKKAWKMLLCGDFSVDYCQKQRKNEFACSSSVKWTKKTCHRGGWHVGVRYSPETCFESRRYKNLHFQARLQPGFDVNQGRRHTIFQFFE